ncbi:MAG: uridine kinase [Gemmatimonadaceae bacterium]|nr:uridine kinase [Gemmatimonadaceae bacterium]
MASRPLIIGIAGGTGSGKSTVARRVAAAIEGASVAFLEMDSYYRSHAGLTMEELHRLNWDHPDAFDLGHFAAQLEQLAAGHAIERPIYDYTTHARRTETVRVEPADVVVVDGILLLVDERVRESLDVKVFVDADADIRLVRRIRRDMASRGRQLDEILDQYVHTVRPMHLQFIEPSKRWADVIVPRGGHNTVAIEMILAKIRQRLSLSGAPHIPMVSDEARHHHPHHPHAHHPRHAHAAHIEEPSA